MKKIDLKTVNHSRPVKLDAPIPGGASVQEICVSSHYLVLDSAPDTAYPAETVAAVLGNLLSGNVARAFDPDFRGWLLRSGAAKKLCPDKDSGLVLGDRDAANRMLGILSEPEKYD